MSLNTRPSLRRGLAVAAPLALVALGLTACNPDHITTMDSPTPSGSSLASTYTPSASSIPAETSASSSSEAPSSSAPSVDAKNVFTAPTPVKYSVQSLTVGTNPVKTGGFSALNVFGDAATKDGAQLISVGLCTGAVYTVTAIDGGYSADAGKTADTDKCATAGEANVATQLDKVLQGKFTVAVAHDEVTLKSSQGELVLAAD